MILVDTSVWIEHLRTGDQQLAAALGQGGVLGHPWVRGELALGRMKNRTEVLGLLAQLPQASVATDDEVIAMIDRADLVGRGIGWVDAHLLAATRLTPGARLWTNDRRLQDAAARLGVAV